MARYNCASPLFALIVLVTFSNAAMIRHIYKSNNPSHGAGFMFKFIGICNIAYSIFIFIQTIVIRMSSPIPLLWFASTSSTISSYFQLGFNVSLAFERFQVVKHPIEYRSTEAKKGLERKLLLIVSTLSLVIGFSCSTLRFLFKNGLILSIPLAASRIIGFIILCILYYKLYFAMKKQNHAIEQSSDEPGQSTSNQTISKRKKQTEHARKFFMGITSSFFILNLPTIIIFFTTENMPSCATTKGILFAISIGLSLFNMLFDTMWYFYMDWRARRT